MTTTRYWLMWARAFSLSLCTCVCLKIFDTSFVYEAACVLQRVYCTYHFIAWNVGFFDMWKYLYRLKLVWIYKSNGYFFNRTGLFFSCFRTYCLHVSAAAAVPLPLLLLLTFIIIVICTCIAARCSWFCCCFFFQFSFGHCIAKHI